jgi:hypothetical protein
VESFTKEAAKVGLTLSELIAKNELAGKETGSDAAALGIAKKHNRYFWVYPENWVNSQTI